MYWQLKSSVTTSIATTLSINRPFCRQKWWLMEVAYWPQLRGLEFDCALMLSLIACRKCSVTVSSARSSRSIGCRLATMIGARLAKRVCRARLPNYRW